MVVMKAILRILHFILYFYVYVYKHLSLRLYNMKQSLRFNALLLMHWFSEEAVIQTVSTRMTKRATHASIVVNRPAGSADFVNRGDLNQLARIISWMLMTGSRHISLFDKEGCIGKESTALQKEVERILE